MNKRSWLPCLFVLLLIFVSMGVLLADDARATGSPAITITMSQTRQTVYITEEEYSNVTFTGTVTAQIPALPPGQVLIVDLSVREEEYQWIFDPEEMLFTESGQEIPFTLDLYVGKITPAGQNEVTIDGRWRYSPGVLGGSVGPLVVMIDVTEYDDGALDAPTSYTIAEGVTGQVDFSVINTGNVDADFILEYDGIRDADKVDVEILGLVEAVDVSFADEEVISLSMIASDVREGDEFTLEVTLMNLESEVLDAVAIQIILVEEIEPPDPGDDDVPDDDDTPSDDDGPSDDDAPSDDEPTDDDAPSDDDDTTDEPTSSGSGSTSSLVSGSTLMILGIIAGVAILVGIILYVVVRISRKG